MSQPKVVDLNGASGKSLNKTMPLPPILQTMRQHARKQLATLFDGLFNNIDDALFEMADRSRSDADQHLYFESMRELRLQRENISTAFKKEFGAGFDKSFKAPATRPEPEEPDFDNVSMVGNEELEISVAVAGIVSKVTSQHSLLVMQLTKRIDHLAQATEITERSNPLGPQMLSDAFVSALDCAELDIRVRIILLKLFERFVMERLASVYNEANQLLIEAGVLPDLKNFMRASREQSRSDAVSGTQQDAERNVAQDSDLQDLLQQSHGRGSSAGAQSVGFQVVQELLAANRGATGNPTAAAGQANDLRGRRVAALSKSDVIAALTSAQEALTAPIDIESVPAVLDLRQLVVSSTQTSGAVAESNLAQPEDDVVNFVGMLFDYILNDRNLAIPMKALIGRLQLPIVKLAIMDRSFFDKSNHPARQLLNELSFAGIGWSSAQELKRDALYNMVESVVLRVMNGFAEDQQIFEELLDELRTFVNNDGRRREQVEQRVKDNEKGRARTITAKQAVQKLINQMASGMRLPAEVGRFVSDTWSKVLVYTCVKDGQRSENWQSRADTLDKLLWCLQPLDKLEDMERRDEQLPELLEQLKAGMATIQLSANEAEKRLLEIESHLNSICANDRAYMEEDEPAPLDDSFEEMDEIVLTLPGEALDNQSTIEVEPQYIEQIGKLREGAWVELTQASGEVLRCKLSTIIEPGGRYVFVNRRGMKVAERSRRGLAVELKRESLTVLEESQVFDRALQAVIGSLRQMNRSPAPSS